MKTNRIRSADRVLYALLALTISLPALAIWVGTDEGRMLFTLYREPKLALSQMLGWIFLLVLVWRHRRTLTRESMAAAVRQPLVLAMAGFVAYGAATSLWTLVRPNLFYELNQYLLLLALLIALHAWGRRDPAVVRILLYSLVFSLVPVVCVGLLQTAVEIPVLRSIDPGYGVRNASFMGYKNPMALALLGHFFLLLFVTWESFSRHRSRLVRLALAVYSLIELAYLLSLQSRSVYFSLLVSGAVLGGIVALEARRLRRLAAVAAAAALAAALVWILLLLNPAAKARFDLLAAYFENPASFLESDRGTYLRNTLNMARHNPFGVGLGDWQTHYPVYRRFNRDLAFTADHQVRRAHGDHVQFLGELGAPGLALWLALLAAALIRPLRHYLRTGRGLSLFLTVQIVALAVAMATDYVLETPYNKLQFFLVCGLAMIACRPPGEDGGETKSRAGDGEEPSRAGSFLAALLLVATAGAAAANVGFYSQQLARSYCSGMLSAWYLAAVEELNAGQPAAAAQRLSKVELYGERFRRLAGHNKTFHKDFLALAHAALLRDRPLLAIERVRESLLLHPFHPNSFGLLASILEAGAPAAASRYAGIQRYLMDEASAGFRRPYPAFFRPAAKRPGASGTGAGDAASERVRRPWRDVLQGRTLEVAGSATADGELGERLLYFCSDGRFYSRWQTPGGSRIDFGGWAIGVEGEAARLLLEPEEGAPRALALATSGTTLLLDGRTAEIWTENDVCE